MQVIGVQRRRKKTKVGTISGKMNYTTPVWAWGQPLDLSFNSLIAICYQYHACQITVSVPGVAQWSSYQQWEA